MDTQDRTILSRRERQIMDIIYKLGKASAADVVKHLPDPPTVDAIRRLINILEGKGHVRHEWHGPRHVYFPVVPRNKARRSALTHVKEVFFSGSGAEAMIELFDLSQEELSQEELEALEKLIAKAKREGR